MKVAPFIELPLSELCLIRHSSDNDEVLSMPKNELKRLQLRTFMFILRHIYLVTVSIAFQLLPDDSMPVLPHMPLVLKA